MAPDKDSRGRSNMPENSASMRPDILAGLNSRQLRVVGALEAVNDRKGEAATVEEVLSALAPDVRDDFEAFYANGLSTAVSRILRRLCRKGVVHSPGKRGRHRNYASVRVLARDAVTIEQNGSRRTRSLRFVSDLVHQIGRAVRSGDIEDALVDDTSHPDPAHLVLRDVHNLIRTGELVVVKRVRGDGRGRNLCLPAELEGRVGEFLPSEPLTWLDQVEHAWQELWQERAAEAESTGRRPAACSTGDLRAVVRRLWPDHPKLADPQLLVNAAGQLARGRRPLLRAVPRPDEKARLWVPRDWPDDAVRVDDVYAHDTERIEEAVRRAHARRGTPAVTFAEIAFEIEHDLSLRPEHYENARYLLADVAKETVDDGTGSRRARRHQRVRHVDCAENTSYFCVAEMDEASAFVELRRLDATWAGLQAATRRDALVRCFLPSVAVGRAHLLVAELRSFEERLESLASSSGTRDEERLLARELFTKSVEVHEATESWLTDNRPDMWLPEDVEEGPTWTSAEFFNLLQEIYPRAKNLEDRNDAVRLFWRAVGQVPNPDYRDRWSQEAEEAALSRIDRTDALLYAARRWGDTEARLQALMASAELGRLRDVRYVLPALESTDPWARVRGIACLAFLGSDRAIPHMERLANRDPDSGVRSSARWARDLLGGNVSQGLGGVHHAHEEERAYGSHVSNA